MIKYTEYKYHLAALFTVTVWGATFVSTKVLIANSLTPAEIFLLRFAMAYVCILPFARGRMWAANLRDELLLAAAGLSGGSLYFLTENMALEYAPASNVSLIVCTAPVWTAVVMSLFYRGERMSRRQIAGSALAFAGMVLVVLNGHFVLRLSPRGDMLALSAAMLWMVYSLVIKRLGGRYPAIFITRKVFFYGLVTILPVFAFRPFGADWEVLSRPVVWGGPALSGCRGLDALLRALERRDAPSGSRQDNQLHLFQPAGDDRRSDALHRRADHPRRFGRSGADPLRDVAGGAGLMHHLQADDADEDQRQEEHPPEGHGVVEENDAEEHGSHAPDTGPDHVGRTHRDRPLGHVEQPAAHTHRHDRKGQKKKMVTRAEVRKFEPQRPPHLEKSCQNQIQPSHRKRFLRTKIANFTSRAK